MRLTGHKYDQERRLHEIALRMIALQARTNTIRACTALSDVRIRNLYRTYFKTHANESVARRRGKSPQYVAYVLHNAQAHAQASVLVGTFIDAGLIERIPVTNTLPPHEVGERLCDAYELYRHICGDDPGMLSFEEAWFIWKTLVRTGDLSVTVCRQCSALFVQDHSSPRLRPCPWCGEVNPLTHTLPPRRRRRR